MKPTEKGATIAPPEIRGAVIDPETGRLCALGRDIAAAWGVQDASVLHACKRDNVEKYQGRFWDVEGANAALVKSKSRGVGNPGGWSQAGAVNAVTLAVIGLASLISTALLPLLDAPRPAQQQEVQASAVVWQATTVAVARELNLAEGVK